MVRQAEQPRHHSRHRRRFLHGSNKVREGMGEKGDGRARTHARTPSAPLSIPPSTLPPPIGTVARLFDRENNMGWRLNSQSLPYCYCTILGLIIVVLYCSYCYMCETFSTRGVTGSSAASPCYFLYQTTRQRCQWEVGEWRA